MFKPYSRTDTENPTLGLLLLLSEQLANLHCCRPIQSSDVPTLEVIFELLNCEVLSLNI